MLAVAPSCITRSSLEEMLEALQRRDEIEAQTPPDLPPALPRRAVPRNRLPSAKRRLPVAVSFKADETSGRLEFRGEIGGIEETASDKVCFKFSSLNLPNALRYWIDYVFDRHEFDAFSNRLLHRRVWMMANTSMK